eukprot:14180023-Ditylum_brightwellii.AAC.1
MELSKCDVPWVEPVTNMMEPVVKKQGTHTYDRFIIFVTGTTHGTSHFESSMSQSIFEYEYIKKPI